MRGLGNVIRNNRVDVGGISAGARNGLVVNSGFVELGGPLIKLTEISLGTPGFIFRIADSGGNLKISIDDTARQYIFGNTAPINGTQLFIDDIVGTVQLGVGGAPLLVLDNAVATRVAQLGDSQGIDNGTILKVDDVNKIIEAMTGGAFRMLSLNQNTSTYQIGDIDGFGSSQFIKIDDNILETIINTAKLFTQGSSEYLNSKTNLTNAAGIAAGTLLNAPIAGNPTKWIQFDDAGIVRRIPCW
jgi:hypothetical protein